MSAQVVDADGNPISGVSAEASREKSPSEFTATTNKSGCLSLGGLTAPGNYDFHVAFSAPGYKPFQVSIPTIQANNLRIVLAKQSQAFTGQATGITEAELHRHCGAI